MTYNKDCFSVFDEILKLFEKHRLSGVEGEALLAFTLGYTRGIQQHTMLDMNAIDNIQAGWKAGALTEIVNFDKEPTNHE